MITCVDSGAYCNGADRRFFVSKKTNPGLENALTKRGKIGLISKD